MTLIFNTVVGNPPYNEDFNTGGNKHYARPLYHHFINLGRSVGDQMIVVTPARFLILKRSQDATRGKWLHVPLQDFTDHSFINWSESVQQIDQQFYTYYGLTEEEQQWIESQVTVI